MENNYTTFHTQQSIMIYLKLMYNDIKFMFHRITIIFALMMI